MTRELKAGKRYGLDKKFISHGIRWVYWSWSGWRIQWYWGKKLKLELVRHK